MPTSVHALCDDDDNIHKLKSVIPKKYDSCMRCGAKEKDLVQDCFAIKLKCNFCNKTGHISRVCKSKKKVADN